MTDEKTPPPEPDYGIGFPAPPTPAVDTFDAGDTFDTLDPVDLPEIAPQVAPVREHLLWWQGLLGLLAGIAAMVFLNLIVVIVGVGGQMLNGGSSAEAAVQSFATTLVGIASSQLANVVAFVSAAVLVPLLAKIPHKTALGLRSAPLPVYVLGALGMLALGPTSDALAQLAKSAGVPGGVSIDLIERAIEGQPFWKLWPILALMPAVGEEVAFRGLLQRSIRTPAIAITASAVGFALLHADPIHIIGVLPLGFYLAFLGHRTGSLFVPIVAHMANNTIAVLATQVTGAMDTTEHAPLWVAPIGWLFCAGFTYALLVMLRRSERDGTPAEAQPSADVATVPTREEDTAP